MSLSLNTVTLRGWHLLGSVGSQIYGVKGGCQILETKIGGHNFFGEQNVGRHKMIIDQCNISKGGKVYGGGGGVLNFLSLNFFFFWVGGCCSFFSANS